MSVGKTITSIIIVYLLLLIFSLVGAVTIPSPPGTNSPVDVDVQNFIFLLFSGLVLSLFAFLLSRGVRSVKSSLEAKGLAYVSALIVGGILALLTFFNFPYAAHVNFSWLGGSWYSPWLTIFLIGAPILLAFVV
jgi:magnesium-transporting ATPase (P-type)